MTLAQALLDLQALTVRLRRECPWDREQTVVTIVPHTVEEAYEVADAALQADDAKLIDELGDLLYQTFFLSLLLEERGAGDLETVARAVHDKLVRRHPHVFAEAEAPETAGAVKERWDDLKAKEDGRVGAFHDLPESLPALLLARKTLRRAAAVRFEYQDALGPLGHLEDELAELRSEIERHGTPRPETEPASELVDELGDVLFTAVGVAAKLNVDPELALRRTSQKFVDRVERAMRLASERGEAWDALDLDGQMRYYDAAKEMLR